MLSTRNGDSHFKAKASKTEFDSKESKNQAINKEINKKESSQCAVPIAQLLWK